MVFLQGDAFLQFLRVLISVLHFLPNQMENKRFCLNTAMMDISHLLQRKLTIVQH